MRELSGSIWPGIALHGAFNAATLGVVFAGAAPGGKPPPMPAFAAIFGLRASVVLLWLLRALALSSRVAQNASVALLWRSESHLTASGPTQLD